MHSTIRWKEWDRVRNIFFHLSLLRNSLFQKLFFANISFPFHFSFLLVSFFTILSHSLSSFLYCFYSVLSCFFSFVFPLCFSFYSFPFSICSTAWRVDCRDRSKKKSGELNRQFKLFHLHIFIMLIFPKWIIFNNNLVFSVLNLQMVSIISKWKKNLFRYLLLV